MKRIGVLISGGGSNLQAIIDASKSGEIMGEVSIVLSTSSKAFGLERAKKENIPTEVIAKSAYVNDEERFDKARVLLEEHDVDLVVLAGCLAILPKSFVMAFKDKMINIHPSLLPKFGGKGYYGKRVHQAVIDEKERVSGCTVHYVDEGTDTGKIIAQRQVGVTVSDTAESLAKKILPLEHQLLVEVVSQLLKED